MTTLTAPITTPTTGDPIPWTDGAQAYASMSQGRRTITITLTAPGKLHGCAYHTAWVEVGERQPHQPGDLAIVATRRMSELGMREGFTDRASAAIRQELHVALAGHRFVHLWTAIHRSKALGLEDAAQAQARELEAMAQWFRCQADVWSLHASALVELVPVPVVRGQEPTVEVPEPGRGWRHVHVVAQAVVAGSQVGWLTSGGDLIPMARVPIPA